MGSLKTFYLIFGIGLSVGAIYLIYRRMSGIDNASTEFSIIFCSIIGLLCLVMYYFVDKLKPKE
ncbi:MAG: hypothetical protein JNL70_10275 [Saprospiraceae bacterium]|nr:hypothetical protein [Saprospiraceae bacterium]